ncbi:MAG: hypothetical protein RL885_28060 [Planctomycetota bacterium]
MSNPPLARLVVACGLLSFLGSAVVASPSAQTSRATSQQAAPDSDREWKEDPERLRRFWESCMSPERYRRAMKETGMLEALRQPRAAAATGWVSTGPFGDFNGRDQNGRVAGIQIVSDGSGGYHLYAGASSGGIWVTHSSTLGDWTPLGDTLPNPAVRAFWVDEANSQRIFVGTGDPERYQGSGMFQTTTGGAVWNPVLLPVSPTAFYRLQIVPGQPSRMVAASSSGLLVSTDAGASWNVTLSGHCTDLAIDPATPQRMFTARRGGGIFRSTDFGDNWTPLTDSDFPPLNEWERASIAICRDTPSVVAVIVEHDNKTRGVYRSNDSGTSWDDLTLNLSGWGDDQMFHAQAIAIPPNTPGAILVGAIDWANYGFEFGGPNWNMNGAPGHADITQLYFSSETGNEVVWVCNDGGIYQRRIVSPQTTTSINGGANGLAISQIGGIDADRQVRTGGLQDNGVIRSQDGGASWTYLGGGDGGTTEIVDPEAGFFWYASGISTPIPWKLWRRAGATSENVTYPFGNSGPLVYARRTNRMYSASSDDVLSRDQSGSVSTDWTVEVGSLQGDPYQIGQIFGSQADEDTLFVNFRGTNAGDLTMCRRNGASWDKIHREGVSSGEILRVATSPLWKDELWITVNAQSSPGAALIRHSTDAGATWEDVDGGLGSLQAVRCLAVTPYDPRVMYAGTDIGVFRTTDGGQSWSPYQDGLPVVRVTAMQFVPDDQLQGNNKLVLSTYGRGTFERVIPGPSLIFVDKAATGTEDGTYEHPFNTVAEALAAASSGDIVMIRANTYLEPQTTTKNVTLLTFEGTSVIR